MATLTTEVLGRARGTGDAGKSSAVDELAPKRWKFTKNHSIIKIDCEVYAIAHRKTGVQHFIIDQGKANGGWKVTSIRQPVSSQSQRREEQDSSDEDSEEISDADDYEQDIVDHED